MKRILAALFCAVFAALALAGFTACDTAPDPEKVNLVGLADATYVVPRDDIDYFVVAEPAASVKIKQTAATPDAFKMVGDLQQLYGGENGYPQAVVVVKNSLAAIDSMQGFMNALTQNASWLQSETTEISTIVNAIDRYLPDYGIPTFNANNLTKQVIANCGIRFTSAFESKQETKSFLSALNAIQPSVNATPADSFFLSGDSPDIFFPPLDKLEVYAPDGAPALAIAGLMAGEVAISYLADKINYHIVSPSTIQTYVTGESPAADICILPVNLAANLLGTAEKYTMLGTVTHGNLYIVSAKTGETITADNLSNLRGKTVGVVNLPAIPGLTFKLILNKYGIEYSDPSEN